jgi:hypothetical protein
MLLGFVVVSVIDAFIRVQERAVSNLASRFDECVRCGCHEAASFISAFFGKNM